MKKINENLKLTIFQGIASLLGILSIVFTFIPAYFEESQPDMSIFQIALGNERIQTSPLLLFGFELLIVGVVLSLSLVVILLLKKGNDLIETILGVSSIVLILVGAVILTCAVFVAGLDKLNSELGFVQGSWGFLVGNYLVPIFALLAIGFTYPCAMIILHHKDLEDKKKVIEVNK